MLSHRRRRGVALLAFLVSCSPTSQESNSARDAAIRVTIAAAMDLYQVAARSVDPDSIAAFYAPTAILFEPGITPIVTRDSIRRFMGSFPGVRVDSATATPDTIEVWDGMALYWGSSFERLKFPGQPLSE
jgi:hypothetical protein